MTGSYFPEEMMDGSFFDDILGDVPEIDCPGGDGDLFPANWAQAESESLTGSDSVFSDLSAELSVSYEDIVQFERLTNFGDDSLTGGRNPTMNDNETWPLVPETLTTNNPFRMSSPVSVLESGSPCSGDKTVRNISKAGVDGQHQENILPISPLEYGLQNELVPAVVKKCGRARSKRSRPTSLSPRLPIPPRGKGAIQATGLVIRFPKQFLSGQKEKKMKTLGGYEEEEEEEEKAKEKHSCTMRRCTHCESTKTPQWRAGPLGPKTLCNACGVRYKTGRLFPEYRPAASPTFVPAVHSNSHKKVLEMRKYGGDNMAGGGGAATSSSSSSSLDC